MTHTPTPEQDSTPHNCCLSGHTNTKVAAAEAAETHTHFQTCQTHHHLGPVHTSGAADGGAGATAEVVQEAEVEGAGFSDGERQPVEEEGAQA